MNLSQPTAEGSAPARLRITVRGAVQGVGFRPFVYRLATSLGIAGWVSNTTEGLLVEAEGPRDNLDMLLRSIHDSPPPNARVSGVDTVEIAHRGDTGFEVRPSESTGHGGAGIQPDLATCEDCLRELFDPADRRHRYPFINCTRCGPRYSIIEDLPYDRARTAMRRFPMCARCRREYLDPGDRRFHAEPNACPDCGPRVALWDGEGAVGARDDAALCAAVDAVRHGAILAVKGLGGFHLLADARNETVVRRLRTRKRREGKPFAVMVPDIAGVDSLCHGGAVPAGLLTGVAHPIVLLPRRVDGAPLAPSVAPDNPRLGVMLPYTPLHHLLMRELGFPVVGTSGNLGDEPIVTDEGEVLGQLGAIADLFLVHDRPILRPVDDSVVQIVCGEAQLLRRARGHAPAPVAVDGVAPGILAFGGHQKATVALTSEAEIALSQHLGDLGTVASLETYRDALADIERLQPAAPRRAVCDAHPDYASSHEARWSGLPVTTVQHHLAHVAACLAENRLAPPALGVAWDGTGFGEDGTVWGGEFLDVTHSGWRRVARLRPFRLPGGDAVAREPRRAALGLLYAAYGDAAFDMIELAPVAAFRQDERVVLRRMLERDVNAPLTSSMGRFFDAFAAICGLHQRASYEGEAAAALEWSADDAAVDDADAGLRYDFPLHEDSDVLGLLVLDWQPALSAALADLRRGARTGTISAALHAGLAGAITAVAGRAGHRRVVLSGGCFQNVRLTQAAVAELRAAGFAPSWHRQVPPNDGGLALGQAAWIAWMQGRGETACV